jgi:chromosome segregation ATPase
MELLGVAVALAVAGGGYALGRREGRSISRSVLERHLDEQEGRMALLGKEVGNLQAFGKRISSLEQEAKALEAHLTLRDGVQEAFEKQLKEQGVHITALAKDTLALGTELKGSIAALELELEDSRTATEARQEQLLQAVDQQLQGMQSFIVQAAEEAKSRREAIAATAPVVAAASTITTPTAEIAGLLEQQRQAQAVFAARRRAAAEAGFPGPGGGAVGGSL